jgi:hypothetical protein
VTRGIAALFSPGRIESGKEESRENCGRGRIWKPGNQEREKTDELNQEKRNLGKRALIPCFYSWVPGFQISSAV